ncbi:leucine-rich repeat-containing protein 46 [Lepisosteus oculatus]|uniref:leucine-rich repeat-containing protein 46 n=1 Tax=Lepisosteus oculatus TaxID=7918 RepID=UPI0037102FB6
MEGDRSGREADKQVYISAALIAERHLGERPAPRCSRDLMEALQDLETVRLDRESISAIGNLECLGLVRSLYLQQNNIKKIENLDCLSSLRFLTLAGNKITRIENLQCLKRLGFLDLSDNLIQHLDLDGLPQSLLILSLRGNPCVEHSGYRAAVRAGLPNLKELDGQEVPGQTGIEEDSSDLEGEEEEEEEDYCSLTPWSLDSIHEFFRALREDMARRSRGRVSWAASEHEDRLQELLALRSSEATPPPAAAAPPEPVATLAASQHSQSPGSEDASRKKSTPPLQPPRGRKDRLSTTKRTPSCTRTPATRSSSAAAGPANTAPPRLGNTAAEASTRTKSIPPNRVAASGHASPAPGVGKAGGGARAGIAKASRMSDSTKKQSTPSAGTTRKQKSPGLSLLSNIAVPTSRQMLRGRSSQGTEGTLL